jgi:hypothetical protein
LALIARIRRTEVRPICNRRDLGFADTGSVRLTHLVGMDSSCDGPTLPFCRAWAQAGTHPFLQKAI